MTDQSLINDPRNRPAYERVTRGLRAALLKSERRISSLSRKIKKTADAAAPKLPPLQGPILGTFAVSAALILALADNGTRDEIALRADEDLQASLAQVVPPAIHSNSLAKDTAIVTDKAVGPIKVYRSRFGEGVNAVAFEMTGQGYAGAIRILMGVRSNGELLGVRVLAHAETPGLGDKIERTKSDWIDRFIGLSLTNPPPEKWAVKKDGGQFDQFSGATITPRGVVNTIRGGLEVFARNRAEMLDQSPGQRQPEKPTPEAG